jgi:ADP-dependent NAD(P)H-hydrate dehydratase
MSAVRKVSRGSGRSNGRPTPRSTRITPALLRRMALPKVDGSAGKEGRGSVLVVGGSQQVPGAVMLAAISALRAGAGKLQIATSRAVASMVAVAVPEARVVGLRQANNGELAPRSCQALRAELDGCDALLVGPGMIDGRAAEQIIRDCGLKAHPPALIVDAAALRVFESREAPVRNGLLLPVLTPHAGEMAQLCDLEKESVLAAPLHVAQKAAARLRAIVVLKGARTVIAAPDGSAYHNDAGNDGLGVSGSGDSLSGIIAGLCARGADPLRAALWGVFLHARAGDVLARRYGRDGYLARQISAEVPPLLASLC